MAVILDETGVENSDRIYGSKKGRGRSADRMTRGGPVSSGRRVQRCGWGLVMSTSSWNDYAGKAELRERR